MNWKAYIFDLDGTLLDTLDDLAASTNHALRTCHMPEHILSTSVLIFLLRPLIGALFGKHNRAVQNALHSFSLVLFIGALLFLFL